MTEKGRPLSELEARLKFFPRLMDIFARDLHSRRTKNAMASQPLLGWLSGFGQEPYAREMLFGIERALARLADVPGYKTFAPGMKASGDMFWSALGQLSLAAFFRDIGWEVELERPTPGARNRRLDLLVRWKEEGLGIELKSVSDLASGWTEADYQAHYKDTPQFLEEIRKYPGLEPVPLRESEAATRLVRSRALKARGRIQTRPRVLALDCSRSQEDGCLEGALALGGDFGMHAVATFSVGGSDLYPETRKIVKESPWLETPLGQAFRLAWEGAARRDRLLREEATRIASVLQREYDPERILLFGSLAQGRVRENSDLDILIIKRTERHYWERISEALLLARPRVDTDVFVYTPEEFEDLKRKGDFFITREVLPCCEQVYERPQAVA